MQECLPALVNIGQVKSIDVHFWIQTLHFIAFHCILMISDVRMAGYSLSSLENQLDSLGATYVDGVKVRVNPR